MTDEEHYDPESTAGVPQHGIERLERMRSTGGKFFTSDLSVNEFVLVKAAGFDPLGLVVGTSIYHVGVQVAGWNQNREMDVLSQAMYHARELAMTRMEEEADQLGADGVVGVRLDVSRHEWGGELAEFLAIGTAVRHREGVLHRAPNGRAGRSRAICRARTSTRCSRPANRPVGLRDGYVRLPRRASKSGRVVPAHRAERRDAGTTHRRSTTLASWPWSECRRRRSRCPPRASSACSSRREAMAGTRT